MPVLHIIATGPIASGKSLLVRHLAQHPPDGYVLKKENAVEFSYGTEYWVLTFEKIKGKKRNAKP